MTDGFARDDIVDGCPRHTNILKHSVFEHREFPLCMPPGFRELMPDEGYPQLPVVDIGLIPPRADAGAAVHALADHISDHVRWDRTS